MRGPDVEYRRTRFLGEVWVNESGHRRLRPLTPRRPWLRGLDLQNATRCYNATGSTYTKLETRRSRMCLTCGPTQAMKPPSMEERPDGDHRFSSPRL
jgi:hypothetical protein